MNRKYLKPIQFRLRTMAKRILSLPINVVFVCHEPSLWSMFDSVYKAMENDPSFSPLVVALPYQHVTLPKGHYKDTGMFEFCESRKIKVIRGYDKATNTWLKPAALSPDYIFFQTPYDFFPAKWSVEKISMIARACYIPYATCLFRGVIDEILHPESFLKYNYFIFQDNPFSKNMFVNKFLQHEWFNAEKVISCGYPKLDYLTEMNKINNKIWKRWMRKDIKHILWTPRWNTDEGNCHFFDYKDFFISFCKEHQDVDFILRPHPLCFQNFLKTCEITENELSRLEITYENSRNMTLDQTGEYRDTLLTTDILVSDISSMMLEYFGTGNPVIYTHRVDVFNELGRKLSEGFYWVNNSTELSTTLEMLISGDDPLKEKRKKLMAEVLFMPEGGSGLSIKEIIHSDFIRNSIGWDKA